MLESLWQFVEAHRAWLGWAAAGSGLLLVLFGVGLPVLAVLLPADAVRRYLAAGGDGTGGYGPGEKGSGEGGSGEGGSRNGGWWRGHPVVRWGLRGLKNALGVVLVLAGVAMLVLPGQGLLTLAAAMLLLDFPGKRRVERRVLGSPRVLGRVNALRRRFGKAAMLPPGG